MSGALPVLAAWIAGISGLPEAHRPITKVLAEFLAVLLLVLGWRFRRGRLAIAALAVALVPALLLATAAGAVAGGYAGNKVQGNLQAADTYTTTERRCQTVTDTTEKVVGYDVTYRIGTDEAVARLAEQGCQRLGCMGWDKDADFVQAVQHQ